MSKPWTDKNPAPYQGNSDVDGGAVKGGESYQQAPGTGGFHTPNPNPTGGDTAKREPGGTV